MPSPSPTSCRGSSSATPRNLSAPTRGDLSAGSPAGLQSGPRFSNPSITSHGRIDEHKENSAENGTNRGFQGRSTQSFKVSSKKPWVTHFSKPVGALSPNKRILVERNSSSSPIRPGAIIRGNGEGFSEQKMRTTPPAGLKEREEEDSATPGRVKGVAELSKRIQQFLEEQDLVLGIKAGSNQELISSYASITPEPGQPIASSPYNPYKSPFFERPTFLHLNGNTSTSDDNEVVSDFTDSVGVVVEKTTEELPLFEGDQVLVTPLQHIQYTTSLSPISTEDDDRAHEEETREESHATALEAPSKDASKVEIQPFLNENGNTLSEVYGKAREESSSTCAEKSVGEAPQMLQNYLQGQDEEKGISGKDEGDGLIEAEIQSYPEGIGEHENEEQPGDGLIEAEIRSYPEDIGEHENEEQPGDIARQSQVRGLTAPETKQDEEAGQPGNKENQQHSALDLMGKDQTTAAKCSMPIENFDSDQTEYFEEEVCWRKRAGRAALYGVFLAALILSVLVSSAGPGLLPSSLINNPVHTFWHSSKYHRQSMLFVSQMAGLWSTDDIYNPADVQFAVGKSKEMFHHMSRLTIPARSEIKLFFQVTVSVLNDWWDVLLLHLAMGSHPAEDAQPGRQFDWMQDIEFVEEWLEEMPGEPDYTDWELLYEYDLGAANQFILGSVPEILKNDLRKNLSHLSDSPQVKGLLEDLMKLKGGSTEEDRLEVLQYFWEYTRFSASAQEAFLISDAGQVGSGYDSHDQGSYLEIPDMSFAVQPSIGVPNYIPVVDGHHCTLSDEPNSLGIPDAESSEKQSFDIPEGEQSLDEPDLKILEMEEQQASHAESIRVVCELLQDVQQPSAAVAEAVTRDLPGVEYSNQQSMDTLVSNIAHMDKQQGSHVTNSKLDDHKIESEPSVAPEVETKQELPDVVLEMIWNAEKRQETQSNIPFYIPTVDENAVPYTDEVQISEEDMLAGKVESLSTFKLVIAQMGTLATFLVASILIIARARQFGNPGKLKTSSPLNRSVQFLRKNDQPQEGVDRESKQETQRLTETKEEDHNHKVTMIEQLNEEFASVLQSPEPRSLPVPNPLPRRDEDIMRSPVPNSITSPYGSFTTYKLMSKKEGQAVDTKLTPVRRSSRIRNHASISPTKSNAVKRIAISPP